MPILELKFSSGEDSLDVRRFVVHESLGAPFAVTVWARSKHEDIDLDTIVGKPASFLMESSVRFLKRGKRTWKGVCAHMELLQAEATGLSTYVVHIVPVLWLLGHRRNHRIFQHKTTQDIVSAIFAEWGIESTWQLKQGPYPKHEYRVQYGETDLDFVSRLLEEAGITYYFADDEEAGTRLTLDDSPEKAAARPPLRYVDNPSDSSEKEYVSDVRLTHDVRPGAFTIRDHDFRKRPDQPLSGEAPKAPAKEDFYEQYHYWPGSFLMEPGQGGGTPVADDQGVARHEEKEGKARATRSLEALRAPKRQISFETNAPDLFPGVVVTLDNHPRPDLGKDRRLLVTSFSLEGAPGSEFHFSGEAYFADVPYRLPMRHEKPRVYGVQSAIVVGPPGEEIYTDEFGRVRVQFHWDREGKRDEKSSVWMRVSQAWAGGGYGSITIPRVGHEVVVGFFDGDPDQPIVVGRVYNQSAPVPYKLPDNKTVSTWKSDSSPGGGGFNEIKYEDKKGQEQVYIQAQKDLRKLVKNDETERTGHDRTISVGHDRTSTIGEVDTTAVGKEHIVTVQKAQGSPPAIPPTGSDMRDKHIEYTTGEAKVVLEGPDILLQANGTITIQALNGDVVIKGGPYVKVNCS